MNKTVYIVTTSIGLSRFWTTTATHLAVCQSGNVVAIYNVVNPWCMRSEGYSTWFVCVCVHMCVNESTHCWKSIYTCKWTYQLAFC